MKTIEKKLAASALVGAVLGGAFARLWILFSEEKAVLPLTPHQPLPAPQPAIPKPAPVVPKVPAYQPPAPPAPRVPAYQPPAPPAPPTLVTSDPIPVGTGQKARVAITASWPTSMAVNPSAIKSYAEGKGFQNVSVSESRPSDWPSSKSANYYVTGTFAASPTSFPRTKMGVTVVEAWKG